MGKRQSKVAQANGNGSNGMPSSAGNGMPASYVMIIKMEGCGHCTTIQQQIDQLKAQKLIRVPVYSMMEADVAKNPLYAAYMSEAYRLAKSDGGFPLLFRVRNGKIRSKADVQLGAGSVESLKAFLDGLLI